MAETGITKNQINFIKKLQESSELREEKLQVFLKSKGKANVDELTLREASEAIDLMKKIEVKGEKSSSPEATGKQINFISKMQDSEERVESTSKYLSSHGKSSINHLTMSEASELIDSLTKIRGDPVANATVTHATKKQIQFIKNLQDTDVRLETVKNFLSGIKKKSFDELTIKEASELIERLKG